MPQPVRWGFTDIAAGLGLFVASIVLAVVILFVGIPVEPDSFSFALSITGYAILIGAVVVASHRRGQRSLANDFGLAFRPIDLAIGVGVGVLAKIVSVVIGLIVLAVTGESPESGNLVLSESTLWIVLSGVLVASLLAPFAEELFFRGLVLRTIRNAALRGGDRMSQPKAQRTAVVAAILLNSVLFMALHLWQSNDILLLVVLGLSTLVFGILNSVVAIWTGRIAAPIIAHIVFNGSAVLALLAIG